MKKLIVYKGDSPICVEGFSRDCKRSCMGSLHLYPKKTTTVTDDELSHIKNAYGFVYVKIQVVAEMKEVVKQEPVSLPSEPKLEEEKPSYMGKSKKK